MYSSGSALTLIMAWCQIPTKPSSKPMLMLSSKRPHGMISNRNSDNLYTFNSLRPSDAYMRRWTNHHWFRQWLVAWPAPSHHLNQCWNIVNWTLGNKLQWNINRNLYIFIQENAFEIAVWKIAAILPRPQWVKQKCHSEQAHHLFREWPVPLWHEAISWIYAD